MSRYIDADELIEFVSRFRLDSRERIKAIIDAQPTADVVEVVRCKDCKHRPHQGKMFVLPTDNCCPCIDPDDYYHSWMPKDDWFCAEGERKTERREE